MRTHSTGLSGSTHYIFGDLFTIDRQVGRYDIFVARRFFNKSKILLRPLNCPPLFVESWRSLNLGLAYYEVVYEG